MKLVSFESDGKIKTGNIVGEKVLDLNRAYDLYTNSKGEKKSQATSELLSDMLKYLQNKEDAIQITQKITKYVMNNLESSKHVTYDLEKVNLKAPILNPQKAMITGPSWKKHVREGRVPEFIFVLKPPTAVIGPGDDIIIPKNPKQVVTEVELAIVVGKPGRYISQDEAWDHIAGFTVFNDVTDMGLYREGTPRAVIRAKSYDTFAAIGPCITLKEHIGNVQNLELKLRLNGEERVKIKTSEMIYPISHFLASVSEVMTLQVGDIVSTGCPQVIPVKPGDSVEAEIENIGILKNQFVAWKD